MKHTPLFLDYNSKSILHKKLIHGPTQLRSQRKSNSNFFKWGNGRKGILQIYTLFLLISYCHKTSFPLLNDPICVALCLKYKFESYHVPSLWWINKQQLLASLPPKHSSVQIVLPLLHNKHDVRQAKNIEKNYLYC